MYRLHKWLGIAAPVSAILHWLWAKGPKWAAGWGWLERPARGPRAPSDSAIQDWQSGQRAIAVGSDAWHSHPIAILIALAPNTRFHYRLCPLTTTIRSGSSLCLVR